MLSQLDLNKLLLAETQNSMLGAADMNIGADLLGPYVLFNNCKILAQLEKRLRKKKQFLDTPFQGVLCEYSDRYKRIFELAKTLPIEFLKTTKCKRRLSEDFNPFSGVVEYSFVKENFDWLLDHPPEEAYLKEFCSLLPLNFSIFHDLCHAVLSHLIRPSQKSKLDDYYFFIEALVMIQEEVVAFELGKNLMQTLAQTLTCYNATPNSHKLKKDFSRQLLLHLSQKSKFPAEITISWLAKSAPKIYPKKLVHCSPMQIELKNFTAYNLKSSDDILNLWQWSEKLFS